ncbi:MAG: hypothetical protein Q7S00_02045, partial [bacterium]|nr:hypothetical protein [bacterium]
ASPGFLSNQLLWQGSLASKNTIGGAASLKIPSGRTCAGTSSLNCAQRYDLDFLRRFTATDKKVTNNGLFSGGGNCDELTCQAGTGNLPSVVTLTDTDADGTDDTIAVDTSILDPFFIQKDDRRINTNPPPGFRTSSQQEFFQEIR